MFLFYNVINKQNPHCLLTEKGWFSLNLMEEDLNVEDVSIWI